METRPRRRVFRFAQENHSQERVNDMKAQVKKQWDVEQVEPVVAMAPDGRSAVVSSGSGKSFDLIEVPSGAVRKHIDAHEADISCLAVSTNGRLALSGSVNGDVRLWDLGSGAMQRKLEGHSGRIASVGFCQNEKTLITASWDKTCRLWHASSGECTHTLQGHSAELSGAFAAPGRNWAVTVSLDGSLRLWGIDQGQLAGQMVHGKKLTSVSVNADGRCLFGDIDGYVGLSSAMSLTDFDLKGPFPSAVTSVFLCASGRVGLVGLVGGHLFAFNFQEKEASSIFSLTGRFPEFLPFGLAFAVSMNERYMLAARACSVALLELS